MTGATSGSTGATSTATAIATSPLSIHKAINTKPAPEKGTGFTSFRTGRSPIFFHAARVGVTRASVAIYFFFSTFAIVAPISAGVCTTVIPHSAMIFIFAAAVSSAPPMIAPA